MKTTKILCSIRGLFKKNLFLVSLLLWILISSEHGLAQSRSTDFRVVFGERYEDAMGYLVQNIWMVDSLTTWGQDPVFTLALVFPELIRYVTLRDRIEVLALSALYVQYGSDYADFSVGRFQMKPSFAENLERDCAGIEPESISFALENLSTSSSRHARIRRLQTPVEQLRYLSCFCDLLDHRYAGREWSSVEDKLRFYATAYHFGYKASTSEIQNAMNQAWYHTAVLKPAERFVYADISLYFFQRLRTRANSYKP